MMLDVLSVLIQLGVALICVAILWGAGKGL